MQLPRALFYATGRQRVWSDCERNEEISHLCGAATWNEIQRPERQDEPAALALALPMRQILALRWSCFSSQLFPPISLLFFHFFPANNFLYKYTRTFANAYRTWRPQSRKLLCAAKCVSGDNFFSCSCALIYRRAVFAPGKNAQRVI